MFPRFLREGCAIGLAASLWTSFAHAQNDSRSFVLTLAAPPECPSELQLSAAIAALLTTRPAEMLKVDAQIERVGERFALSADWGSGPRRLQGDSCEGVARALVAIVALALDPAAHVEQVELGQAEAGEAPSRSEAAPARAEHRGEARGNTAAGALVVPKRSGRSLQGSSEPGFALGGSLLALGEWGALPTPSYGFTALGRGSIGRWSLEAGGSWLARQWAQVQSMQARKGGYISWMALQGNGCRALARWALACAGVEVGELRGEGSGLSENGGGSTLWLAGTLSGLARVPLGAGLAAEARAVAAFPTHRPEFSVDPYPTLHRPSWVSGRLSLGIGFR